VRRLTMPVVLLLIATTVALSGCDDSVNTFEGHGISFDYPDDWNEAEETSTAVSSGNQRWSESFGIDENNFVTLTEYEVNIDVSDENIADLEGEIGQTIEGLTQQAGGTVEEGPSEVTMGGLPGFRFKLSGVEAEGGTVDSSIVLVFDGTTEYFLNCQFTAEHRDEIDEGCTQIIDSFEVT
jgi:PsbP-like protein